MKTEPWHLTQVEFENTEEFKNTLLKILHEGRKLTPFEMVKLEFFLNNYIKDTN